MISRITCVLDASSGSDIIRPPGRHLNLESGDGAAWKQERDRLMLILEGRRLAPMRLDPRTVEEA